MPDYSCYPTEDLYYMLDQEEHWKTVLYFGFASIEEQLAQDEKN